MLTSIILIITAIILALLWYAQSSEQRRKNTERARVADRIQHQRLEDLKVGEDIDVTIIWGDVIAILESLKNPSSHAEGVQGIKDLAVLIDNQNLIIKKQGQLIRLNDISHLQTLVDTYDSEINCHACINDSNISSAAQKTEQIIESTVYDSKKEAYLGFAKILSAHNEIVFDEISLYFDYPEKYFDKFYFDMTQRGISKITDLEDVIVLIDALSRQNFVVYQDSKTELYQLLELLDSAVDNQLSNNSRFLDLIEQAKVSLIDLSLIEEKQGESVFKAINKSAYKLLSIDENSDAYAFILVPLNQLQSIIEVSQTADIKLDFIDKP